MAERRVREKLCITNTTTKSHAIIGNEFFVMVVIFLPRFIDREHPLLLLGQTTIFFSQTWSWSSVMLANVPFFPQWGHS